MLACCCAKPSIKGLTLDFDAKYDVEHVLGVGNYAVVRYCRRRSDGKSMAVKMIDKSLVQNEIRHLLRSEVTVMQNLDHPNIIKLFDVYESRTHINLVIELATGGALFDHLSKRGPYSEHDAARVVDSVARALAYMHSRGITHRDIKPENVLFSSPDADAEVKVSDFGLSKLRSGADNNVMRTRVGTPAYVAPEILRGSYGPGVDVWALGAVLYVLLCGFTPFHDDNVLKLYAQISKAEVKFPSPHWNAVSPGAKDLVRCMLRADPDERFTPAQVMAHPWVTSMLQGSAPGPLGLAAEGLRRLNSRHQKQRAAKKETVVRRELEEAQTAAPPPVIGRILSRTRRNPPPSSGGVADPGLHRRRLRKMLIATRFVVRMRRAAERRRSRGRWSTWLSGLTGPPTASTQTALAASADPATERGRDAGRAEAGGVKEVAVLPKARPSGVKWSPGS